MGRYQLYYVSTVLSLEPLNIQCIEPITDLHDTGLHYVIRAMKSLAIAGNFLGRFPGFFVYVFVLETEPS